MPPNATAVGECSRQCAGCQCWQWHGLEQFRGAAPAWKSAAAMLLLAGLLVVQGLMSLLDDEQYGDVEQFLRDFGGRSDLDAPGLEQIKALQVRAGQGRAGQGRAGQGRAGQGRAGQGRTGLPLQPCSASQLLAWDMQMWHAFPHVADNVRSF